MENKLNALRSLLAEYTQEDCALAFSGGIDSSLLLKLLCEQAAINHTTVYAVTFLGSLHPQADLETAERVAAECDVPLYTLTMDELSNPDLLDNPIDRCYICKKYLFQTLKDWASAHGAKRVIEGTNEDDLHVYRPGIKAVRELEISSPLAELGITKEEVRAMARSLGISVAERPSAPCMATRLPYGTRLNREDLQKIEAGEAYLHRLGFTALRLRLHKDVVRIELPLSEFETFLAKREEIIQKLHELGFVYLTLDIEGLRSGSMDVYINK